MPNSDGSVISSYFGTEDRMSGDNVSSQGMSFMEGQVDKIHFIDDQSNISKKYVEYDVNVRAGDGGQSKFRNVRHMSDLFGTNDYHETILEANEFAFSGKLSPSNFFVNQNGTYVVLAALHGSKDKPFIVGTLPHPKKLGAKRADGVRKLGEFRGVEWNINKDGELIITQRGARSADGKLKASDKINTILKFDKEGNVSLSDKELNKIYLDRENKKIILSQTSGSTIVNSIEMSREEPKLTIKVGDVKQTVDGAGDKITLETKGGLKVELDGTADKATFTTSGGPKVTIDGAGNIKLEAGATIIEIDGNSGKISLTGQMVDVGAAASALAALGPQLVAWATSHTHIYVAPAIPAGPVPTSPPIVPPPPSVLSTTVKIKA